MRSRLTSGLETGAIISGGKGAASDKVEALERAGAVVAASPAKIGELMLKVRFFSVLFSSSSGKVLTFFCFLLLLVIGYEAGRSCLN